MRSDTTQSTRRSLLSVARGVFRRADDSKKQQLVDVDLFSKESKAKVEHWLPYGFTFVPQDGAEALTVFLGGNRSHGIVVGVSDRRHRPTNLKPGEVAMHDDQGQILHLTRDGIHVKTSKKITFEAEGEVALSSGGTFHINPPA